MIKLVTVCFIMHASCASEKCKQDSVVFDTKEGWSDFLCQQKVSSLNDIHKGSKGLYWCKPIGPVIVEVD